MRRRLGRRLGAGLAPVSQLLGLSGEGQRRGVPGGVRRRAVQYATVAQLSREERIRAAAAERTDLRLGDGQVRAEGAGAGGPAGRRQN